MVELHAQKRPGRPAVLTLLCAALLTTALLAAWAQSSRRQQLGPEVHVSGTPVRLRLPVGWQPLDDTPPTFGQPAGRSGVPIRTLTLRYGRRETFLDPGRLHPGTDFRRTRLGPLPAVEFRTRQQMRLGRKGLVRETLVRVACSPRGDWLYVEYAPLRELTPADAALFEAVCRTVRLDGLEPLGMTDVVRLGGMHFEPPDGVRIFGGADPGVRGVWITGGPPDAPPWVIGVFRTFLVPFRGSDELLQSLAVQRWDVDASQVRVPGEPPATAPADAAPAPEVPIVVRRREDGAFVLRVENPHLDESPAEDLASAIVVERSARQVAMLLVFAGPQAAGAAEPVVQRLAESLRFEDSWPDVEAAAMQGRELARLLARRGALPWWGKLPPQSAYGGLTLDGPAAVVMSRWPREDDPAAGYAGCASLLLRGDDARGPLDRFAIQTWQIGPQARRYRLELTFGLLRGGRTKITRRIEEWRDEPDGPLLRRIGDDQGQTRTQRYLLSEAFIAPPVEPLAEWLVASGAVGPAVIENSLVVDGPPHWSYLQAVSQGDDGQPVLLRVDDDWPLGEVRRLREPGEADQIRLAHGRLRPIEASGPAGLRRLIEAARRLCRTAK